MGVKLVSASAGSVEIVAPATASNFTATMPAVTGTVVLQNASNNLLMNSGYGSDAVAYGCRAWVNFNGTSTVAIRASGNVSSITDNGTGDYTVNMTTAMPDTNYAITACVAVDSSNTGGRVVNTPFNGTTATTSAFRLSTQNSGTANDCAFVYFAVFR
jgi:hypothetical protein